MHQVNSFGSWAVLPILAACVAGPSWAMPAEKASTAEAVPPPSDARQLQTEELARCALDENLVPILVVSPEIVRPGTEITLHPYQAAPYAREELPLDCITSWHSDPEGALATSVDAQGRTRLADDLPAGSTIVLSYRIGDELAEEELTLAGRDEVVLTGTRTEAGRESCIASQSVGEIAFRADGTFSVTFRPFEAYNDYWGTYRFDPVTGELTMEATGGNAIPQGLDLSGSASVAPSGGLTLSGIWLGDPEAIAPPPREAIEDCEYRFE